MSENLTVQGFVLKLLISLEGGYRESCTYPLALPGQPA